MTAGVRLAVWSGPRNISTALMRSWENRPDCRVVDEPLYAYYLAETGLDHPGREQVIAAGSTSWPAVVAELTAPVEGIYYQKHMAHHLLPHLPRDWIAALTNVLLIRDPAEVVASYVRSRAEVVATDIGHWPAGPRASDGVWAPYWYRAVLGSTGFEPYRPREVELHGAALEAAQRSRPDYERLHAVRVVL